MNLKVITTIVALLYTLYINSQANLSIEDSICLSKSYSYFYTSGENRFLSNYNGERLFANERGDKAIGLSKYRNRVFYNFMSGLTPVQDKITSLYGYINSEGQLIIPHKYNTADQFYDGLAAVSISGKYGIIDTFGNNIIPLGSKIMKSPINNIIPIRHAEKWGLVNLNNDTILQFEYDKMIPSSQQIFIAWQNNQSCVLNKHGKELIDCQKYDKVEIVNQNLFKVKLGDKYALIDSNEMIIIDTFWNSIDTRNSELYEVSLNRRNGIIDSKGKIIIEPLHDNLQIFEHYIFTVNNKTKKLWTLDGKLIREKIYDNLNHFGPCNLFIMAESDNKYEILDRYGVNIFNQVFSKITPISDGYLLAKSNNSWAFYSITSGNKILSQDFKSAKPFHKNVAILGKGGNKYLINKDKREISQPFYHIKRLGDFYIYLENKLWGLMDKDAKEILAPEYSEIEQIYDKLYSVNKNGQFGLHDGTKYIIEPKYDKITYSKKLCNYIIIEKNGYSGIVRLDGELIILPELQEIDWCWSDLIKVKKDNQYGIINSLGEFIVSAEYDEIVKYEKGNLCGIKANGKWGFVNREGRMVIRPIYDDIYKFKIGIYFALVKRHNTWSLLDQNGDILKSFQSVKELGRSFLIKENNRFGVMDLRGDITVPIVYDSLYAVRTSFIAMQSDKLGVVYDRGDVLIEPIYDSIYYDKQFNYICVVNNISDVYDKYGNEIAKSIDGEYINSLDNWLVFKKRDSNYVFAVSKDQGIIGNEDNYLSIQQDIQNRIRYKTDHGYGYMDELGNKLISKTFGNLHAYNMGIDDNVRPIFVDMKNRLGALISNKGTQLTDYAFHEIIPIEDSELIRTMKIIDEKYYYGIIDGFGKEVIPISKNRICSEQSDGLICVTDISNKCGYYNTLGHKILNHDYNECHTFENGLAKVAVEHGESEKKYGIIDTEGRFEIPILYDGILSYSTDPDSSFRVKYNNYEFIINTAGECFNNCPSENILEELKLISIE